MTTISIKELHERTGLWVRQAAEAGEVIITDHGHPIARLLPPAPPSKENPFKRRRLLPGAAVLLRRPLGGPVSEEVISNEREGR